MGAYIRFVVVMLGTAAIWVFLGPRQPLTQPIAYNHAKHAPTACVVCHEGVERGARAGYPSEAICLQCHNTAPKGTEAVWPKSRTSPRIPWVRVNRVADHVFFSHRRHVVLANLECDSCHADIGRRSAPPTEPATRSDMAACERCHAREKADNDCAACHV